MLREVDRCGPQPGGAGKLGFAAWYRRSGYDGWYGAYGQSMTGTYGTTTLWDRVNGGYVTDAYGATGSDGQVAPTCN